MILHFAHSDNVQTERGGEKFGNGLVVGFCDTYYAGDGKFIVRALLGRSSIFELFQICSYLLAKAIMAKRKRGTDAEMPDEDASVEQRRLQHKLKIGTTKLGHAFKVAKGFERQKLSRRRKTAAAQSNDKDVDRIDSEVAALKVRACPSCRESRFSCGLTTFHWNTDPRHFHSRSTPFLQDLNED